MLLIVDMPIVPMVMPTSMPMLLLITIITAVLPIPADIKPGPQF